MLALSVSLAAGNPAPKPHFEVCLLGPLVEASITGPVPWEADSETDTCLWKVYWKTLSASASARERREHVWGPETSWAALQTQQEPQPIPQRVLEPVVPQSGARGFGVYRPPLTMHWIPFGQDVSFLPRTIPGVRSFTWCGTQL